MEVIMEEYTNKKGEKLYIQRFIGKVEQCLLTDGEKNLTPMVSSITYDEEREVFFIIDSYHDVYEDRREATVQANLYFYVDFNAEPVGQGYSDIVEDFFPVCIRDKNIEHDDRWFLGYACFKRDLGLALGEHLECKKELNLTK